MRRVAILVAVGAVTVSALTGCGPEGKYGASSAPGANLAPGLPDRSLGAPVPVGPTIHPISITVRDGRATGDTGRVTVPLGTPVTLSVTSDVADEVHVRGYDRKATVPAGGTGSVSFTTSAPGVFDVALEGSKLQLLQLQVS